MNLPKTKSQPNVSTQKIPKIVNFKPQKNIRTSPPLLTRFLGKNINGNVRLQMIVHNLYRHFDSKLD